MRSVLFRSNAPVKYATLGAIDTQEAAPTSPTSEATGSRTAWATVIGLLPGVSAASRVISARINPSSVALRAALAPGMAYGARQPSAQVLALLTVLGKFADARLYPSRDAARRDRLIIGFHGNGTTADDMDTTWRGLATYGQVLAVNIPGYGGTPAPDNGALLELHMAAGVQAALDYATQVLKIPVENITWYGMSLGGTQAAIGFAMAPGSDLVLHNTLTRVGAVVAEVREQRPNVRYTCDGLNTLQKLRNCHATHVQAGSRLFVVGAEHDEIMGHTFPQELWQAYYGDDAAFEERLCVMPGATHNTPISHDAAHALKAFMQGKSDKKP